jgi:ferredoxin-type protein NapH
MPHLVNSHPPQKSTCTTSKPLSQDGHEKLQAKRLILRIAFFTLFILAPILDIFRLDLNLGQFIFFGNTLTLDIDPANIHSNGSIEAVINLFSRVFLPFILLVVSVIYISWRWGRLYCGWLCPHLSMVELINGLWRRTNQKPTLWDRHPLPLEESSGRHYKTKAGNRFFLPLVILFFAVLWSVSLLTYMLPPKTIYGNLLAGTLTWNQAIFIGVATFLFTIDFTFARHLFCRFGCAVGMAQSVAWFTNNKALVVGFERYRVAECSDCSQACDNICPMRIKPRAGKGRIVSCTQCGLCVEACAQVKADDPQGPLLYWVSGTQAKSVADPKQVSIPKQQPHEER